MTELSRVWRAERPLDLRGTLAPLVRGAGDPAHRPAEDGFWWACMTPAGPGTMRLAARGPEVTATAWGMGAAWLLERLPTLLGEHDDWSACDLSGHPRLHDLRRRRPGLRLVSTGLVMDSLVPAVLEQRVTGLDARRAWKSLLWKYGEPAPGPRDDLRVPPTAAVLLQVPTWDWHRFGVDLQRQRAIRAAATVAGRLEECTSMPRADALHRLQLLPGIGVWTAAETAQRAWGDPDAVSVGDYHIKDVVVHWFTGRARGTDAEMMELLADWTGHRQRVVRLVEGSGVGKPRFGPRFSPVDIRAI
ncbi:MAG: DNA-3-methyladenine glycosylase family protein [Jatrophihabitans sp.]|uniref:DNA-3-methyladenine glycosylase family protein n=1 Tax=Jatrophihabitans sp. TaxID=1932789 RepID=UPI003F7FB4A2